MQLFDDIKRTYKGPSLHNENTYNYYERSARKDISIIRAKLNDWFQNYPESEKKEFRNSFEKKFDDCFFELFLFQLFSELGFNIKIHPNLTHSSKRPDFLLSKDNLELYVEAKTVKDKSQEQEALERKINQFFDDFSKVKINGFLLSIDELSIKTKKQPSTKHLVKFIEKEILKFGPDQLTKELENSGFKKIPVIKFENEDIRIIIKPIPLIPAARNKTNSRPIGIYPGETFWGGGEDALKNSINEKAKKYGKLDKPYIICINSLDIKTEGKMSFENTVWGSIALSWSENPNNRDEKWIRKRDGIFLNENGPRLKNLSGVLITRIFPHNIPIANYWLFRNPFSTNTFNFNELGLKYNYVKDGKIISGAGDNLNDILKISKDWISEK